MRVRLLSWNIHKCIGGVDRSYRPDRVIDTIAHHAPELVMLQEVANSAGRKKWHRQIDLLGDELGFRHRSWFPNHRFKHGGEYGNAILSHWPITHTENIDLTVPGRKVRSVLHARVRVRTSKGVTRTMHAFCLHLGLTEKSRREQMDRYLQCHPFAGLHQNTPIVVAGDFNDVWGKVGDSHLLPAGFRGMPRRLRTFPAVAPIEALDSVFVRGDLALLSVQTSRLQSAKRASDHLPLICDLELARTIHDHPPGARP